MHSVLFFLKNISQQLRRENLHKVSFAALALLVGGALLFSVTENMGLLDSLWWSVVTMTTVGYGDISPASPGGKIVGVVLMLTGIGFLGLFTATIASVFVENKIMENKGMKAIVAKDHFVICGWNFQGLRILKELLADAKLEGRAIVILANLEEKPSIEEGVYFVRGDIDAESIEKTCLKDANTAILLCDDTVEAGYRDAKMVMDVLNIRSSCPSLYICAELADAATVDHAKRAGANEIIVGGELRSKLLVQAALDHGITELVSELVSNRYGHELYKFKTPQNLVGKRFFEALCELKKEKDIICLGLQKAVDDTVVTNPPSDLKLEEGDHLLVVAEDRTSLI